MPEQDKRGADPSQRKNRVALGFGAAVPAILLAKWIKWEFGLELTVDEAIYLAGAIGSITSVASICFWDLRGIAMTFFYHRRGNDPPRRKLWRRKGGDR